MYIIIIYLSGKGQVAEEEQEEVEPEEEEEQEKEAEPLYNSSNPGHQSKGCSTIAYTSQAFVTRA
jgi:hypothetical protein